MDASNLVASGSDAPITPLSLLVGVHIGVNHPNPKEAIGVCEALKLFTMNATKAGGEKKDKGSISPGKLGDFAVVSHNLFLISKKELKNIRIKKTIIGGRIVCEEQ